jgi:hypothetical protein
VNLNDPTTIALIWALLTAAIISAAVVILVLPRVVRYGRKFAWAYRANRRVKLLRPRWTPARRRAFLVSYTRWHHRAPRRLPEPSDLNAWDRAEAKRTRKAAKGTASRLPVLLALVVLGLGCATNSAYPTWHPGPTAEIQDRRAVGERCLSESRSFVRGKGAWPGGFDVRQYDRCMRAQGWVIDRGNPTNNKETE